MAKICLCLTGKTLSQDVALLEKYRKYVDLVELRADCLEADERLLIRRFPPMVDLPVILTIRREQDGGQFIGGEGSRISLLSKALAFADADRRHNFAYVDMEEYLNVPSLEEAARTFGTRIIRSYHNIEGVDDNLVERLQGLRHIGDELVKVAVMPHSLEDVVRLFSVGRETMDMDKILLGMGNFGIPTRILAEHLGSQISYTTVQGDPDLPAAAPGQLDPKVLAELYRFRDITNKTRIFGITGFPLIATFSPPFFNTLFSLEHTDAVYVPFPTDDIRSFIALATALGMIGASVTVPHKEGILPFLTQVSPEVRSIGACNTIVSSAEGWTGFNTDAPGFSDTLLSFIGKKTLKGIRGTIIGAGGAARAVLAEVHRLHGKALVLNRNVVRARDLAAPYRAAWGPLDNQGIALMDKYGDIIIQTTSAGMEGHAAADPLALYTFSGKEVVMDLIYKPERTTCLQRAEAAGCRVLNGYAMLIRQAQLQYSYFMGREFPQHLMSRMHF
ncbi:MAG: type I 3-dehydroquinate dehydratase [Treponema sp.]|jgi:3-dehydroquinate dehydratase/shikimate dehydrogenase|nr:type I 3-dehydroquinate dehydratase [Treponema sp.]